MREAGALHLSLVAEKDGSVIGHVAASPVEISDASTGWFGLGPLSVTPGLQCHGIGSLLMKEALRQLQARGVAGCVLLGDPTFYSRFGFHAEPDIVLPDVPEAYFQALAFGKTLPRGIVSYHAAFGAQAKKGSV